MRTPKYFENSPLIGSRSKEIKSVLSPTMALILLTSDHQWQNYCNKEFTFWIFVIISDIHAGVGAHCFGADIFSNLPGIRINSLFSFLTVANPGDTVSIHCCKHKWAVVIQVHIPFFNGFGGGRTTLIDACITEGEVEQHKSSCWQQEGEALTAETHLGEVKPHKSSYWQQEGEAATPKTHLGQVPCFHVCLIWQQHVQRFHMHFPSKGGAAEEAGRESYSFW